MRLLSKFKKLFGGKSNSVQPRLKLKSWPAYEGTGEEFRLFSEDIIEDRPDLAMEVLGFASKFSLALGWHYLLDLAWILARLPLKPQSRILDAGAGTGILQFILAAYGHQVVSADAFIRTPPATVGKIITVKKSGSQEAMKTTFVLNAKQDDRKLNEKVPPRVSILPGEVEYHCCDLERLQHLQTNEFDAIVSVSALEHNPPEKLPGIMAELRRVAKPGASLLLTISVDSPSRFDEPSHSWLLDQTEVTAAYGLTAGYATNFSDIETIRKSLRDSKYLDRWLASLYYRYGDNGMPWGNWNPTYLPAGLLIKNRK